MPDASVAEMFPEITYEMQAGCDYAPPNSTATIFASDNVHYQQVAYNALGIDIANNLHTWLKEEENAPEISIYQGNTMRPLTDSEKLRFGEKLVLSPVTDLNDLTFTVSGCIELTYPLQITATGIGTGTLTVSYNETILKQITFICVE